MLSFTFPALVPVNKLIFSVVAVTPSRILISAAVEVTDSLLIWSLFMLTSPLAPYTTALSDLTIPDCTPSSKLSSAALDFTRTLFNLSPPSTPSCEAIFNIWSPLREPITTSPELLWVTALPFWDVPKVVIPLISANESSSIVVAPNTRLPLTFTSLLNTEFSLAVNPPSLRLE